MNVFRNLLTVATRPALAYEYVQYSISRACHAGQAVRIFPEDGVELGNLNGFSEYHSCAASIDERERRFLKTYPFADGTMLDVGANLGLFSLLLARRFPARTIYAFEPNPSTYQSLCCNLARNSCRMAHAHALAVADHDGEVTFASDPLSRATASIAWSGERGSASKSNQVVRCTTLNSFTRAEAPGEIALLKVDVEGYESAVFDGAKELLASGRVALVYFEICPELARRAAFAPEAAAQRLEEHGYQLRRLDASGRVVSAARREIADVTLENWLAVRPT